ERRLPESRLGVARHDLASWDVAPLVLPALGGAINQISCIALPLFQGVAWTPAIPQRDFLSVVNALSVFGLSPSQPSEQIRIRLQPRTFLGALTYRCSSVTSGGLMTPRSRRSFQERDDCSRAAQILAGKPLIRGSLVLQHRSCGKSYCRCQKG